MEFIEEEYRPRVLFVQGRGATFSDAAPPAVAPKFDKIHAAACFFPAALLLLLGYLSLSGTPTLASLLLWAALSLLLAPFAPLSATGGDVRVGVGDPLPEPEPSPAPCDLDEPKRRFSGRRSRSQKPDDPPPAVAAIPAVCITKNPILDRGGGSVKEDDTREDEVEEREWTDADLELLKKQISKHPAGEPRRWEKISEAFAGRHGLDSVIRTAKSLSERKPAAGDSFQQFLKQRKPVDKRVEVVTGDSKDEILLENGESTKENGESVSWIAGDDIALLNALKAFPKDASMRWEKIAAAVPGKSKAACMKRVTELKKDFRSSKASEI